MTRKRPQKLSASLEDYLEAIFNIAGRSDVARSRDIAESLGVAKSSVTGALKLLGEKGLVNYRPYGYVTLTESGVVEAAGIARKHNIIKSFFVDILGVDSKVAQESACKAEHTLGSAVVSRLLAFMDFVNKSGKDGKDLARDFKKFCRQSAGKNNKFQQKEEKQGG